MQAALTFRFGKINLITKMIMSTPTMQQMVKQAIELAER